MRGRRSQLALSRTLGYQSNAIYSWEAGHASPPASRFFAFAQAVGVRQQAALARFFRTVPTRLVRANLATAPGVRALLQELLGTTRLTALAAASGLSRFSLSRWIHGKGQPDLSDLLCFVEHTSMRLPDLIATWVDPLKVPSIADRWSQLQRTRSVGYEFPFSHAVLRALEISSTQPAADETAQLCALLGAPKAEVEHCLSQLAASGQIRRRRDRFWPRSEKLVDFRHDPQAAQQLKAYWAALAHERTKQPRDGLFAYTVFAVSKADLARVQTLQRDYIRQMRTIIAASEPSEVVALANFQIFDLGR